MNAQDPIQFSSPEWAEFYRDVLRKTLRRQFRAAKRKGKKLAAIDVGLNSEGGLTVPRKIFQSANLDVGPTVFALELGAGEIGFSANEEPYLASHPIRINKLGCAKVSPGLLKSLNAKPQGTCAYALTTWASFAVASPIVLLPASYVKVPFSLRVRFDNPDEFYLSNLFLDTLHLPPGGIVFLIYTGGLGIIQLFAQSTGKLKELELKLDEQGGVMIPAKQLREAGRKVKKSYEVFVDGTMIQMLG